MLSKNKVNCDNIETCYHNLKRKKHLKIVNEPEKYFVIQQFEEGWGMDEVECEEQVYDYCIEVLFIPEDKIEELTINIELGIEINLTN